MDPACGTGGFFIAVLDYMSNYYNLDKDEKDHLKYDAFTGWEIVQDTRARGDVCSLNILNS